MQMESQSRKRPKEKEDSEMAKKIRMQIFDHLYTMLTTELQRQLWFYVTICNHY